MATLTYSLTSVMPHTMQHCSKLKNQFASSLESPSNFVGLLSFNYAAILPVTTYWGIAHADAASAAYTAENAACHLTHTSATMFFMS